MATSYVEQAILRVKDESSKPISKINAELRKLFATARKPVAIKVNGLAASSTGVRKLSQDFAALSRRKSVKLDVSLVGAAAGIKDMNRLHDQIQRLRKSQIRLASGGGGKLGIDIGPMKSMFDGVISRMGYAIENAILSGLGKGTQQVDIAETRLRLQGLSTEEIAAVSAGAAQIAAEFPQVGRGSAMGLISEVLPTTQGDITGAVAVSSQIAELVQLQTALGVTSEQALEGAIAYAKAGEQMGALTDAAGKIDPKKAEAFFDTIERGAILVGKEFGPSMVQGFIKYARTSKYALDEKALLAGFLSAEEQGTTAGVGLNQAIKQLSGERVQKKQLNKLIEYGLITEGQVKTGELDGKTITEIVGAGAVDEEGLRTNFYKWVNDVIIPTMKREGFDPNNPVEVSKFAGQITSDRTATDALASAIIRAQEISAQVNAALGFDVTKEGLQEVAGQSVTASIQAVQEQFLSTMGAVGNSFESILIPALNATAGALSSLTNFLYGEDGGNPLRTGAVVGGAALGAYGLMKGGKAALNFFNPLMGSAIALDSSAAALTAAAVKLGGAGVVDGLSGGKKGVGPTSEKLKGPGALSTLLPALMIAQTALNMPTREEGESVADAEARQKAWREANAKSLEDTLMSLPGMKWLYELSAPGPSAPATDPFADAAKYRQPTQAVWGEWSTPAANPALTGEDASRDLRDTFEYGTQQIDGSAEALGQAGQVFGPAAAQALLAAAGPMGQAMGQAIAAQLRGISLGVNGGLSGAAPPMPRLDTGASGPM